MSEYQRIAFRAIDGPVSDKNLEYMRRQSSRAEVTPWSFDNEYHYGDFGGDALEMMRRGYDLHLHYANFGIRKLLIRLLNGLPDPDAAAPYFGEYLLKLVKDKAGKAGTLVVEPCHEPGDLEDLWNVDELVDRLVPLRAEILEGDLRPLYLAHLAVACDGNHDPEESREGPTPAGLEKPTAAQQALMELYGLSPSLVAAAARRGPRQTARTDVQAMYAQWLQGVPQATKDAWLAKCMSDPHPSVRREMLEEFRRGQATSGWPTLPGQRTIAELRAAAEVIQQQSDREAAAKAAKQRAKRLASMAQDPAPTLRKTGKLVKSRSTEAYREAATLLADLREALAGSAQAGLAEEQARKLKMSYPTLNHLTAELRRQGFVPK